MKHVITIIITKYIGALALPLSSPTRPLLFLRHASSVRATRHYLAASRGIGYCCAHHACLHSLAAAYRPADTIFISRFTPATFLTCHCRRAHGRACGDTAPRAAVAFYHGRNAYGWMVNKI